MPEFDVPDGFVLALMIGGPFDGDEGLLEQDSIPATLWCYPCPHGPASECEWRGVHWTRDGESAPAEAEEYVHDGVTEHGQHRYKWADLVTHEGLHEEVMAGATA